MASALSTTSNNTSMALQFSHAEPLLSRPAVSLHMPPQHNLSRSTIAMARNRNRNPSVSTPKKKKKSGAKKAVVEEDDPFEALFSQLEEDLKNDDASNDVDDEDINDEDFELLARELEEVLGADGLDIFDDDDVAKADDDDDDDVDEADDDEDEEEEEAPLQLKNWQLKRLARALQVGRRKTSIKNLAGELNLDRAIVLSLLRDPPPSLVMLSATLPDEPRSVTASTPETKTKLEEIIIDETEEDTPEPNKTKVKEPVHMMQEKWSAQKRLKKVQVETMERVYRRSKRPTNTMVSSIVHVTNLPRQRVLKWFEDRRTEEGVTEPGHSGAYQRSVSESVST